jgi:alpha-aminoadipate carrier protein LysW
MAIPCPVCDAGIDLDEDELDEGDTVTCDECGAELRVTSVDPPELESLEEDEEDDDEAGDFEEEDEEEEDENWK